MYGLRVAKLLVTVVVVIDFGVAEHALAQRRSRATSRDPKASGASDKIDDMVAVENAREMLRSGLAKRLNNPRQVKQLEKRLERMSPQQIRALTRAYQRRRYPQRTLRHAEANLQQTRARLAALQRQRALAQVGQPVGFRPQMVVLPGGNVAPLNFRRPAVGFAPQIIWLPTGTSLNAAATVSPDRRYVRVNVQPFFSSIRAVHTYNLKTGELRRIR